MKKLIFVDDEPNILQGLKRMLRSMRKEYEMFFAEGAKEALEIMEEVKIDAVISDMRMPGMDGAQLLTEIQKKHPHTIRIMLTGQADEESVLRTVGVVHQFLAKPCDPDKLKEILRRTGALQDLLTDGTLKDIVSKLGSLPSLPSTFSELQDAMADPEVEIDLIASIIEKDVAMSAKILQLVNSSFFGLFTSVDTPERAVSLLGLDTIRALVLGVGIFSQIELPPTLVSAETLWTHSLMVGKLANKIAMLETNDKEIISNSFLTGILHDVGKLVLVANLPDQYCSVIDLARKENITLRDAELQVIHSCHGDIGAYLAGLWGFNISIVEGIGFCHQLEEYSADVFTPALAVHAANVIYYIHRPDDAIGATDPFNSSIVNEIVGTERFEVWKNACDTILGQLDE
jgi:HD-like signal output (HDOD) protein/CheY-like chemotaxis protein